MVDSSRKVAAVVTIAAITITPLASPAEAQLRGRVGAGGRSGGGVVGGSLGGGLGSPDLLSSAATGAAVGAMGGPIGMAVGAGLGLLHGLWAKKKYEEHARAEAERQRAMDRELERQMATQRPGGPPSPTGEEQGVLFVKDHLAAEAPSASPRVPERETQVAAVPGRDAGVVPARDGIDAEGFRPVFGGSRLVRRGRRAADGSVEQVLHYDTRGRLVRRDDASRSDGRLDTSAFYADGVLQRKESDTDGDGNVDVWAFYDGVGDLARLETLVNGSRRTEVYRAGRVAERLDGDLLSVFDEAGQLVKQGRKGAGDRMLAWRYFEPSGAVVREEEFGDDGRLSAVAHYEAGRLVRRELYEIDEAAFSRVPLVSPESAAR